MPKFKISCEWTMTAIVEVEAHTLTQAAQQVKDAELPKDGVYLGDSFRIDEEDTIRINGDINDWKDKQ